MGDGVRQCRQSGCLKESERERECRESGRQMSAGLLQALSYRLEAWLCVNFAPTTCNIS